MGWREIASLRQSGLGPGNPHRQAKRRALIPAPRKASVETPEEEQKRKRDRKKTISFDEIRLRLQRLKVLDKIRLHHLFDDEEIHRMCDTLHLDFRDRVFTPAITLGLFVSQVLSRADPCTTVMAKFNRER